MGKQLVLKGNKVVAYGEDCFLCIGNDVLCTTDSTTYENATVAECDGYPSDIDSVGYEYHAGKFVPCAPYGTGTGTIAVWGENCKMPLDSGINITEFQKMYTTTYTGAGSSSCGVTCGFKPKMAIIFGKTTTTITQTCIMSAYAGCGQTESNGSYLGSVTCTVTDTGLNWSGTSGTDVKQTAMNASGFKYSIIVFG